jgi:hypothetical protein
LFVIAFGFGRKFLSGLFPALSLYQPQWCVVNWTGMGLRGKVLIPVFNQSAWRQPVPGAVFPRAASLLPLLALAGVMNILVLTENPLVLYPLALISAAGVLTLLALVYSMVWMLLLKKENLHSSLSQMVMFLVAGFGPCSANCFDGPAGSCHRLMGWLPFGVK